MKIATFLKSSLKLSLCFGLSSFVYAERGDSFRGAVERCHQMAGGQTLQSPVWVTCQRDLEYYKKLHDGSVPVELGTYLSDIHVKMKGEQTPSIEEALQTSSQAECNIYAKIEASLTGTGRYTCSEILDLDAQIRRANQQKCQMNQQQQQQGRGCYSDAGDVEDFICGKVLASATAKHSQKVASGEDLRLAVGHVDAQDDAVAVAQQCQQQQKHEMAAVVYRDTNVRVGCVEAPTGQQTQQKGKTAVVSFTTTSDSSSSVSVADVSSPKAATSTSSDSSSSIAPQPAVQQQQQGKAGGGVNPLAGDDRYVVSNSSNPSDSSDYATVSRTVFGGAQFAEEEHHVVGDRLAHKRSGLKVTVDPLPGSVLYNAGVRKGDFILEFFNDNTMHRAKDLKWFIKKHASKAQQQTNNLDSKRHKETEWKYYYHKAEVNENGVATLNEAGQTKPAGEMLKGKVTLSNGVGEDLAG